MLNIKIRDTVKKRDYSRSAIENLKGEIKSIIPNQLCEDVVRINDESKQQEQVRSKVGQRDKYYRLRYGQGYSEYQNDTTRTVEPSRSSSNDKSKWVVNISKCELSNVEKKGFRRVQALQLQTRRFNMMNLLRLPSKLANSCHNLILLPQS